MSNRSIYAGALAFAAAAAFNAHSPAGAETPGHAPLMQLIHEDLDAGQQEFTLALAERAGRRIAAQQAARETAAAQAVLADRSLTAEEKKEARRMRTAQLLAGMAF